MTPVLPDQSFVNSLEPFKALRDGFSIRIGTHHRLGLYKICLTEMKNLQRGLKTTSETRDQNCGPKCATSSAMWAGWKSIPLLFLYYYTWHHGCHQGPHHRVAGEGALPRKT